MSLNLLDWVQWDGWMLGLHEEEVRSQSRAEDEALFDTNAPFGRKDRAGQETRFE